MYRNNSSLVLLASAERTTTQVVTTTTSGDSLLNYAASGIRIILNVTAVTDTPSIDMLLEGKTTNGLFHTLLQGAAVTGVTKNVYEVFPKATVAASVSANSFLPKEYRITITHADTDAITYSLTIDLLR